MHDTFVLWGLAQVVLLEHHGALGVEAPLGPVLIGQLHRVVVARYVVHHSVKVV